MTVAVVALRSKAVRYGALALVAALVGALMLSTMIVAALVGLLFGGGGSSGSVVSTGSISITFSSTEPAESVYALQHIPATQSNPSVVTFPILYAAATQNGSCVIPWPILAGVTNEESTFGTSTSPGVRGGSNYAGAQGPFQFEPATFAGYVNPIPKFPGAALPPSAYDAVDAAFAAARKLCDGGILTDAKLALWTYNAGGVGISYSTVNGVRTVVYNDAPFAHSSDNPVVYVADVMTSAAAYGSGTVTGSSSLSVTGLAPGSGNVNQYRQRSALWMALLANGNCQASLQTSCFDALPTIMGNYDGVALPPVPSQMQQDLLPASTPLAGDIILFGGSVTTTDPRTHKQTTQVQINDSSYGVVIDPAMNTVALVSAGTATSVHSAIETLQLSSLPAVGSQIGSQTVQFIGSPFG